MLTRLTLSFSHRLSRIPFISTLVRNYSPTLPLANQHDDDPPSIAPALLRTRAGYAVATDGIKECYEQIPETHLKIFEDNLTVTNPLTESFSSSRRAIGEHFKDETRDQDEAAIRKIKIRNLQTYRNELGPTVEFLRSGTNAELDAITCQKLREEYHLPDAEINLKPINPAALKSNLEIIQSSFTIRGGDFNFQHPAFLAQLEKEKENIKKLPAEVQEILKDLKDAVYAFAQSPEVQRIVEEHARNNAGRNKEEGVVSSHVDRLQSSTPTTPKQGRS